MEILALFGSFWLLIFVIGFVILGIVASEADSFFLGTITFIFGLFGLQLIFDVPIWGTIVDNPLSIVVFLIIYVAAGSAYAAFWRWPNYIESRKEYINSAYESYIRDTTKKGEDQDFGSSFDEFVNSHHYRKFTASANSHRLSTWVLVWPFSITWELMHKPIKWVYRNTYRILGQTFENVGKRTARNVINEKGRN